MEGRFFRPAKILLGQSHLFHAKRRAMSLEAVLLVGRPIAEMRAHQDQGRTTRLGKGGMQRLLDRRQAIAFLHTLGMPAISGIQST
ncbi:hypothetical protein FQZ97_920900 [compost metagenome]